MFAPFSFLFIHEESSTMNDETKDTTTTAPSFDTTEKIWFDDGKRESSRPTLPAPAAPAPIDDEVADAWFYDV